MSDTYDNAIAAIQAIAAVPSILDVICRSTGMGFAAVARVTEDRWIACQVLDNIHFGLPAGGELKVETTLCHEVRQHREVIAIDNVDEDPTYCNHHTPRIYGLQSYISVPIVLADGRFFGTLCAIDPKPAKLNNPQILGTFKLFAELIAYHLDASDRISMAESSLATEHATAGLREEFIAVLGHDLRNPLAAIDAGAAMLQRDGWSDRSPTILRLMRNSVARMNGLIGNVMDLTRARLGSGIRLNLDGDRALEATLAQVVDELKASFPEREIEASFAISKPVAVDHVRMAQLLSNLLGNAVTHGASDQPIRMVAATDNDRFELSVVNGGEPIPPAAMDHLFKAFYRADVNANAEGLGLGLYIAAQIAEAHKGRLQAVSNATETRFTFEMPIA